MTLPSSSEKGRKLLLKNHSGALRTIKQWEKLDIKSHQIRQSLLDSEAKYKALFDFAPSGIAVTDLAGKIHAANQKLCELMKLSSKQLMARNAKSFYAVGVNRKRLLRDLKNKGKIVDCEIRLVRDTGEIFPASIHVTRIKVKGKHQLLTIIEDISKRQLLEKQILNISDNERHRIGRDLHDALGGKLAGTAMIAMALSKTLAKKSRADSRRALELVKYINETIRETRAIARGLCPFELGGVGLVGGLTELIHQTKINFEVKCTLSVRPSDLVIENSVGQHLFRIAQEAIFNAIRHGKAKKISIRLSSTKTNLTLQIKDNGCGMLNEAAPNQGLGLASMKYRSELIGGCFKFKSSLAQGTCVRIRLPVL